MKGRRNQHQWDYMGWDIERKVEYGYCDLCKKYRYFIPGNPGFTFITKKEYVERMNSGKIVIS